MIYKVNQYVFFWFIKQTDGDDNVLGLELAVRLKGINYREIAEMLDVTPQSVSSWVNRKREIPTKRLKQLSKYFGVDESLLGKEISDSEKAVIHYQLGHPMNEKLVIEGELDELDNEGNILDYETDNQLTFEFGIEPANQLTLETLESQIKEGRAEIKTDEIDMTISELFNMYHARNVIDIHPEFQRLFRWSKHQKSKLIESILLGIPIPPLFIAETENSSWDIIDGVQRLSTLFEFMGVLIDENEEKVEPSILVGTDKLPALEGKVWENKLQKLKHRYAFSDNTALQNKFLFSKLKIIRVSNESNPNAKYDIFDRLNTGGSKLTPQEVRNCLAIMMNRDFYIWLRNLSLNPNFRNSLPLSEKAFHEQADIEFVLRFIVYRHIREDEYSTTNDIHELLTSKMKSFCLGADINLEHEKEVFDKTFKLIQRSLGDNAFKKYDGERFKGQVMLSSYEVIAIGIANNLDSIVNLEDPLSFIYEKTKNLYNDEEYEMIKKVISGRAVTRFGILTNMGSNYFKP